MKLLYSVTMGSMLLSACTTSDKKLTLPDNSENIVREVHVNYGHNIIVAIDMSNRIEDRRRYEDPAIVKLITDNLRTAFAKSIEGGINGKFLLTTINIEDFKDEHFSDPVFRIDLTRFKNNAVERSNYLYHNSGQNSLKYDLNQLNTTFEKFYQSRKNARQLPADMWYFFQDKLDFPLLDTSSSKYESNDVLFENRYKNYIIILTDGYIEAGRYGDDPNMRFKNKFRFLSSATVDHFRSNYSGGNLSVTEYFKQNDYGIMPVNNTLLKDCNFLVLELFDRSEADGVSTKTPKDMEILKLFWKDWLVKSGVPEANFQLKSTMSDIPSLSNVIKQFLNIE